MATPPLNRLVDVTGATAALLILSPLLLVTLVATLLVRRDGAVAGFLYRSGLADLPNFFDVVGGRRSLLGKSTEDKATLAEQPASIAMAARPAAEARRQIINVDSDLDVIGQHFRKCFGTAESGDFEELLTAIDRSQNNFGGRTAAAF